MSKSKYKYCMCERTHNDGDEHCFTPLNMGVTFNNIEYEFDSHNEAMDEFVAHIDLYDEEYFTLGEDPYLVVISDGLTEQRFVAVFEREIRGSYTEAK